MSQLIMIQSLNSFRHTKTLFISAFVIALAACSDAPQSTTNPDTPSVSPSLQTTITAQTDVSIPGVKSLEEIEFQPATTNPPYGYFDAVNRSTVKNQEVSSSQSVQAAGWAVLPREKRPADTVIVTFGDSNSLVAVAPVRFDRVDVAQAFKEPNYTKVGWVATFDASTLPAGQIELKAWAYNPANKTATQLTNTFQLAVK